MKKKYFVLFSTIIVALSHIIGSLMDWYSSMSSFDTYMHALGGFWIASVIAFLESRHSLGLFSHNYRWKNIILLISLTATVGVLWEFFEFLLYTLAQNQAVPNIYEDTLIDLLADMAGAFLLSAFVFQKKMIKKESL